MPNKFWQSRIQRANQNYREWATRFKCDILENYYEGKQWSFNSFFTNEPYVVNLVYSTIKIKAANLLLSYPQYHLTPKPGNADYNQEMAIQSAQIKEDTLNTIIDDEKEAFCNACHLVFLDSMFRFGVMEVGYASDWLRNPLQPKPLLDSQETTVGDDESEIKFGDPKIVRMPDELPENEKIYFKHIEAKRFRVGNRAAQELDRCDWVGYYEFVSLADLKAIKNLKSEYLDGVTGPVTYTDLDPIGLKNTSFEGEETKEGNLTKIWHVWDIRAKKRYLLLDSPCEVVWEDDFKRLPIKDLKWDLRLNGWYPMPPVFQWLSPQNEYNETREQMRSHRKRFTRKFQVMGEMEQEEIDKFTNSEDGALIKVPRENAISPIGNPDLGAASDKSLILSKDDFNEVSGTSSADRGRADRTTATESQRLGMKADIRDSAENSEIMKFMTRLGREALLLASERFTEGTWAKLGADPGEDFLGEINENPAYQWVTSEKLDDGYDFKVNVEIISASPIRNEEEEKKFLKFLSVVQNFPQIALSPLLVREAAYRCGYRNERVIKEMQKMAQLTMMGAMQQAQGNAVPGAQGNAAQNMVAQQTPNTQEQITNQLKGQLVQ